MIRSLITLISAGFSYAYILEGIASRFQVNANSPHLQITLLVLVIFVWVVAIITTAILVYNLHELNSRRVQ